MSASEHTSPVHVIDQRADGTGAGDLQGDAYGVGISVIRQDTDEIGVGPRLHRHPYPETFVIVRGRARFTVGSEDLIGEAGQIIVVPAYVSHKFSTLGPDRFESINIHESGELVTEWLE